MEQFAKLPSTKEIKKEKVGARDFKTESKSLRDKNLESIKNLRARV
jgi:hypothetical protein